MRRPAEKPDDQRAVERALLHPDYELTVCVCCGTPTRWKYDKKGRPYHYCSVCGVRIFLNHLNGVCAFEILQKLVTRFGPRRMNAVMRKAAQKKLQRVEQAMRAEAKLASRARRNRTP